MSMLKTLENYLTEEGIDYELVVHSEAFTAQEVAATQHVPGRMVAKVVMLKSRNLFYMVAISAKCKVDFIKAKEFFQDDDLELAGEAEFEKLFPGCEVGAMPPFGNLYDMKVYVGPDLSDNEYIVFNAGNHVQTVKMKYVDFERLVKPEKIDICARA